MAQQSPSASLPPLEWLRVFEAAGRTGSFTAAALELNLTQAAVSQRIRNLEARLGCRLFIRLRRGVELSADGEAYLPHVQTALAALARSTSDLFAAPRGRLTIATPLSVAQLWIAPRLAALATELSNLEVSIAIIQRPADYSAAEADLEVRFGDGKWPGHNAVRLYPEILAPVVAPSLLEAEPEDWRRLPQIAVSGPRDGWREWAAATCVAPPRPPHLRFDSFAPALAAAVSGAGVLLASLYLAERDLAFGRLVRLREPSIEMARGYWLTRPASEPLTREHDTVIASLTREMTPAS